MRVWARSMGNVASSAYLYWFTWAPPIPGQNYGAFHAGEIGYIFGNTDLFGAVPTDADHAFSDLMASIWTQFAKTGDPNGEGLPAWPAFTSANEAYLQLGPETAAKSHLRMEQMALLERAWAARRAAQ
jgi:para-nitrobenzyl esterase